MNKKDIYSLLENEIDFIDDINKNIFVPIKDIDISKAIVGYKKSKNSNQVRKLDYNMLVFYFMKQINNKDLEYISRRASFMMASNLTTFGMHQASEDQLIEIMRITGYSAEALSSFKSSCFLSSKLMCKVGSNAQITLLAKVIHDSIQYNNYTRLQAVVSYMYENKILHDFINNEISEYENFVSNHIKYQARKYLLEQALQYSDALIQDKLETLSTVLKMINAESLAHLRNNQEFLEAARESISNFEQGQKGKGFLIEKSPEDQEKIARIETLEDCFYEISDATKAFIDQEVMKNEEFRSRNLKEEYNVEVLTGSFAALLKGDDIWKYPIVSHIWIDIFRASNYPLYASDYGILEDEDAWDYEYIEFNDHTTKIWMEQDMINVPIIDLRSDDMEDKITTLPLVQVMADYADHYIPSMLFMRNSIKDMFRKGGLSERRARDLAVIVAFCQAINNDNRWDDEAALSSVFKYYESQIKNTKYDKKPEVTHLKEKQKEEDKSSKPILPETDEKDTIIDELRKKLKDAENTNKRARHDILVLQREIEYLNNELDKKIDDIEEDVEVAEEIAPIEYPYETETKITLYGGFDTFHKEIQKLIPSIRIIPPTSKLGSADPLRNSDFVFLQTNKLDHSNYHNVKDASKNAGIPFYHLKYASARRCADFIVRTIENYKKDYQ